MYDTFSSDYDRFVSWPGRLAYEMPFIEQHLLGIEGVGAAVRVLDAACGTGRHAIDLAQRGFSVSGADLSPAMIERARENAAEAGVMVNFHAVGFGELAQTFAAEPPFDAVLCLGNSLPHVLSPEDLRAALADFAACLRPGGRLLVQNRNFDALLDRKDRWMEPQSHREGEREWIFYRFYDYDPDGLITFNIITLRREGLGGWQQQVASTRLYPLRRAELEAALKETGFTQVEAYGSLAGESFDPESSGNLVVVAEKEG